MALLMESLNPAQKEAATKIDRHVRIVAGAGSGKTRVLMARIEYLLEEIGIWPNRILAITFTNKAANEMKERLAAQVGDDLARQVRISTIHALCVRILREDATAAKYPKNFTIMDTDDQKSILRHIYKELDADKNELPVSRALSYISSCKSAGISPQEAQKSFRSAQDQLKAQIYEMYEQRRKSMLAMDFDDLLLEADALLKTNDTVRTKWQNRLDFIHVDEFQDVDPTQYSIIRSLTGRDACLCVVGDPDQTIYTWRGASVNIILQFDKDFKPCHTVILDQNYRSAAPILDASNALIENNKHRIKKNLFSTIPGEDKLVVYEAREEEQEPMFVARKILELHRQGMAYEDIAILYRNNYSSRLFEKALRAISVPYRIYGGVRFYDRAEIKDVLSYLKLLTSPDPEDPKQKSLDLAVLRVINQPKRGIGARTIEKIQQEAALRDVNLLEVMKDPQSLSASAAKKARAFYEIIEDMRREKESMDLCDLVDLVLDYSGYEDMLLEAREDERLDNAKELAQDILQAQKENPELTLESYLQDVSLFSQAAMENQEPGVNLMTVHASKGTEYPAVFIVNFNETIFPSARAIEEGGPAGLEEERRLLYVAMTRAQKRLFLTWNLGYSYQLQGFKQASRFLLEIPEDLTEQADGPRPAASASLQSQPASVKKASGAGTFSARKPSRTTRFHKGDVVEHTVYGEGRIVSIQDNIANIAFPHPVGIKKINTNHPSLSKK